MRYFSSLLAIVLAVQIAQPAPALAWNEPTLLDTHDTSSPFSLQKRLDEPRNAFGPPLVSFFLPGFDQWWEWQNQYGLIYTGVSLVALQVFYRSPNANLGSYSLQVVSTMGGLSAYHSFRTAVRSRPSDFAFLKYEETPAELAIAPFRFDYLGRWTTLAPLGVGIALNIALTRIENLRFTPKNITLGNGLFALGTSYNAGFWEEAAFRGWLMPEFRSWTDSDFWSNGLTALLFAAAHLGNGVESFIPYPQFIIGFYLGYLTQLREWTISESIFVHAWWDVLAFTFSLAYSKIQGVQPPQMFLPLANITF